MEGRVLVKQNEYKQVIRKNACKCAKLLGIITKVGTLLPIDVFTWKKMSESDKEDAWSTLLEKFDFPIDGKDWLMSQLNEKWKYHKYKRRRKYFNETSDEVIFPPQPNEIVEPQYINLWNCWKTDEFQEENTRKPLGRDELWIMTRTHSDRSLVKDSSDAITKIRELQKTQPMESSQCSLTSKDDILTKALGPYKHGRVRCLGPDPTPSYLWGKNLVVRQISLSVRH
ncbi:uncharacterized protein LOC143857566 [Tasmannia lanceolata]|uniref:uncharacterized protein LOC143857566 n=1 Tax=Tasmannia lanceolata TaxID=3420 RepID=UPI004063E8FE